MKFWRGSTNMKYHCSVCDKLFKKFIIFEGHFDFNEKCRAKGAFLQCYICSQEFRHLATLKYHISQHASKFVFKVPQVPKITLKKQWNFKILPPKSGESEDEFRILLPKSGESEDEKFKENEKCKGNDYICKICKKAFKSTFYMQQHLIGHSKKRFKRKIHINNNAPPKDVPVVRQVPNMKSHLKTSPPSSGSPSLLLGKETSRRQRCKICNKICSSASRLGK